MLGYGVTVKLCESGWNVRAMGNEVLEREDFFPRNVEYVCGDFFDDSFLASALEGVDKVFFFISTTFPSTSKDSLELEITRTLYGLDYLLRKMRDMKVHEIVYPSSGGTVYGNLQDGVAKEESVLRPITPYGVGKKMCEDILEYYTQFGICATIIRVGNVYGAPMHRTRAQGVIDLFVQKALRGEHVDVWDDALQSERDYIFYDDFSDAVARIADYKPAGVDIYNLGSGVGTSLAEIIRIININTKSELEVNMVREGSTSSIKRIVLDMSKFKEKTGWEPRYSIEDGIIATIKLKKMHS